MPIPDVPVTGDMIINEYHQRVTNMLADNIRLTAMLHQAVVQRDDALSRWSQMNEEARMWEMRYTKLEEDITAPKTVIERRMP